MDTREKDFKSKKKFKDLKGQSFQKKKNAEYDEIEGVEPMEFHTDSRAKWYEEIKHSEETTSNTVNFEEANNLKKEASSLFNEAVILNSSKAPKSLSKSEYTWVKTVLAKGTKTDKIAAYTLLIQDSPLYQLNLLKSMVEMVKIGKNKECFMAIDTACELFLKDLLPPDRKLMTFVEHPLSKIKEITSGNVTSRKRRLILWYFEDQLKSVYADFVNHLNKIAHNSVDANKEKAITAMCKLLEGNPEKENILLNNIVNKLGDPSHKVGSKVIYALTKLLETHPNMREVVVDSVEKVIFRTNISKRAQYYSVCFLSQFCLYNGDSRLAKKLISIYLCLFKSCIKMGDVDSRMMSALLSGVKRAYPFAKEELGLLKEYIDTIYKVIHLSHANIAIQALSLVYLICDYSNAYTDRFYTVLYKKTGEPDMFKSSHHAMLLSLIHKALKKDNEKSRICAFIKRLLQICAHTSVPVACGILIVISAVLKVKKDILIREIMAENVVTMKLEDCSDEEEYYEDVKEEKVPLNETPEVTTEVKQNVVVNVDNTFNIQPSENVKVWSNPDKSVESIKEATVQNYDPFVRNPLYSGADKSLCCELYKLTRHFHPTVSLFATKIVNGEGVTYSGDPLLDFTLIRFLDKFSFKNPKEIKPDDKKTFTFSKFGRKKYYSSTTVRRLRANTADYLNHSEKNIPMDEIFLYRYMKEKLQTKQAFTKENDTSDLESVASEEFDEILSGVADGKKDDIDFLSEVGQLPKKTKKKTDDKVNGMEDEEDLNDEEESDLGSEAEDFEGDEMDEFGDDDEEMQGSDLDESELETHFQNFKLPNLPNVKEAKSKFSKKGKGMGKDKLFASAEEFSELLEDADYSAGGSEAFSNKDKAGVKQLKWESDRDKWIHKKNFRSKGIKRSGVGKKFQKFNKGNKKKRF